MFECNESVIVDDWSWNICMDDEEDICTPPLFQPAKKSGGYTKEAIGKKKESRQEINSEEHFFCLSFFFPFFPQKNIWIDKKVY